MAAYNNSSANRKKHYHLLIIGSSIIRDIQATRIEQYSLSLTWCIPGAKISDLPRTIFTIKEDYFIKISSYTRVGTTWVHWLLDRYSRIRNVHWCVLFVVSWSIESGNYGEFDALYWVCRCKLLLLFFTRIVKVCRKVPSMVPFVSKFLIQ